MVWSNQFLNRFSLQQDNKEMLMSDAKKFTRARSALNWSISKTDTINHQRNWNMKLNLWWFFVCCIFLDFFFDSNCLFFTFLSWKNIFRGEFLGNAHKFIIRDVSLQIFSSLIHYVVSLKSRAPKKVWQYRDWSHRICKPSLLITVKLFRQFESYWRRFTQKKTTKTKESWTKWEWKMCIEFKFDGWAFHLETHYFMQ